jgi:cupin 2 domain-containing protein
MNIQTRNLFADIPAQLTGERFDSLVQNRHLKLERIVSRGHRSAVGDWFDQDRDEWVILLTGRARLHFDGAPDTTELKPGDYLHIPAHQRHRVTWTDPEQECVWLALHYQQNTHKE